MIDNVLTPLQAEVLEHLFREGLGDRGFFLSGGTGLAAWYLGHRYSDDLDLFVRTRGSIRSDIDWAIEQFGRLGLDVDRDIVSDGFGRLFLTPGLNRDPDESLKVEFVVDAGPPMDTPTVEGRIIIDSFEDIAANKISAITGRMPSDIKDHVDLYFILARSELTVEYLLSRAREKDAYLERGDGMLQFATNLLEVERWDRVTTRMIEPLDIEELRMVLAPIARNMIARLGTLGGPG